MEANEFYHYGRKGMKWGIRRGPPYPWDEADAKDVKNLSKETSTITKSAASIARRSENRQRQRVYKRERPANEMTDSELQRFINRANLERQYNELTDIEKTRIKVSDLLDNLGDVIAITGGLASTYLVVQKVLKKLKR